MNLMPLKLSSGTASQQPGQNGRPEAGTRSAGERGAVRHVYFWRKPYFPSTQNVQTGREVLVSFSYPSSQGPGSPGHYMNIVNIIWHCIPSLFFFCPLIPEIFVHPCIFTDGRRPLDLQRTHICMVPTLTWQWASFCALHCPYPASSGFHVLHLPGRWEGYQD